MDIQMAFRDSTEDLVYRAKDGDRAAFDVLVERFHERLRGFVDSRLGEHLRPKVDVDDILQDAYVRALESLDGFSWKDEQSFYSWLRGIAEHVVLYAAQKYRREEAPIKSAPAAGDPSPSRARRREERFERLQAALTGLSVDHQEVIRLARLERLRIGEIAKRMNRSEDAVHQLLARALRKLKTSFGDTESLHLPNRSLTRKEEDDAGD